MSFSPRSRAAAAALFAALVMPAVTSAAPRATETREARRSELRASWVGTLTFSEVGSGEPRRAVRYRVALREEGARLVADVDIDGENGVEAHARISAEAVAEGTNIRVFFTGYRHGNVGGFYGPRQRLFTFVRRFGYVQVYWGAVNPVLMPKKIPLKVSVAPRASKREESGPASPAPLSSPIVPAGRV